MMRRIFSLNSFYTQYPQDEWYENQEVKDHIIDTLFFFEKIPEKEDDQVHTDHIIKDHYQRHLLTSISHAPSD